MNDRKKKSRLDLQWQILIGIIAGILLGIVLNKTLGPGMQSGPIFAFKLFCKYGGDIFVRLLRMMIVPLVFASIFMAVVNLGDIRELGRIGSATVIYYLVTTALAVLIGILLVNVIHPGRGIDKEALSNLQIVTSVPENVHKQGVGEKSVGVIITDTLINMIPKNPAAAMAKGDILQIIFFTIFFAVIAAMVGKDSEPLVNVVDGLDKIMVRAVMIIMLVAPYCIFLLVAAIFMDLGFAALAALGKYALTVLLGLAIHAGIVLPLLVIILGRYNPVRLFKAVSPAVLTAWSTASSAATLPLTMECLQHRAGVDRKIGNFVLPLGATVNMDGTIPAFIGVHLPAVPRTALQAGLRFHSGKSAHSVFMCIFRVSCDMVRISMADMKKTTDRGNRQIPRGKPNMDYSPRRPREAG